MKRPCGGARGDTAKRGVVSRARGCGVRARAHRGSTRQTRASRCGPAASRCGPSRADRSRPTARPCCPWRPMPAACHRAKT
eukprot:4391435-Prymnesium_polylepis.2